jgi:AcrR family transcriptional regulator
VGEKFELSTTLKRCTGLFVVSYLYDYKEYMVIEEEKQTMPKAFTEQEKELIRKRLLEQGHKQFSAYGLRKTNIEELAEAAGISKGAFYLFYDSKEALFMEVVEQVEERLRQELFAMVDLPGPSPRARLFAILHHAFHRVKTIPLLRFLTGRVQPLTMVDKSVFSPTGLTIPRDSVYPC